MKEKKFYSTSEIADLFHVYPSTVADWIDGGHLIAFRTVGGHRRVRPADLRSFLDAHKMEAPEGLDLHRPTVLVVDDDEEMTKNLRRRLTARKLLVETASSGFEGVYKIAQLRPDVVILDILMPGMDGIEVCEQIRSRSELKDTVVIAITGYEGKGLQDKVMAAGATTFVKKPVDADHLVSIILQYTHVEVGTRSAGVSLPAPP
ncbi:MAG: response regulator [Nitrospirae bacterium]|nr:response regulator [Nitrospirota bacterium]